ncbi:MAG: hypothetical protein LBT70_03790 [Holosporaceae bacterium]|nr:hypothetical protein [Holosporaceae bacterium]
MKIEMTSLLHNKVFFTGTNGNASISTLSDIIFSRSSQTLDFKRILRMALGTIFISFVGINGANATEQKSILSFDNYSPLENRKIYIRDINSMSRFQYLYYGRRSRNKLILDGTLSILYSNGHMYKGDCWNGIPDGEGTLYETDKGTLRVLYKGHWKDGLFSGDGFLTFSDQSSYEGLFEEGLPHGCGFKIYPLRQIAYKGNFVGGQQEGIGQLLCAIDLNFCTMKFIPNQGKWVEKRIPTQKTHLVKILHQGFWKNNQLVATRKFYEHPLPTPSKLKTMFRLPEAEESAEVEELTNEPQEPKTEDETLNYSDYFFVDPQNSDL